MKKHTSKITQKKILFIIYKGSIEDLPPLYSVCAYFNGREDFETHLVTYSFDGLINKFFPNLVKHLFTAPKSFPSTVFGKIKLWLAFRFFTFKILKNYNFSIFLWVGSADTAIALGKNIFKYKYYLHIHELYDEFPIYKYLLKKIFHKASKVIVPDETRSKIFKVWFNLKESPFVLPNKSLLLDRYKTNKIPKIHSRKFRNKKILMFLGLFGKGRDLSSIAKAAFLLGEKWKLVLIGRTEGNILNELKQINPDLIHILPIKNPNHLDYLKSAYIGIISYDYSSLNNIFCAPNKLWEYTKYGLPILSNDVPNLKNVIERYQIGKSVDMSMRNVQEIYNAIKKIDNKYSFYQRKSRIYYQTVNVHFLLKKLAGSI